MTAFELKFKEMFECDVTEVRKITDTWFLILGWNRNTKEDKGIQSFRNGEPFDFAYVERHCVASGKNLRELRKSAELYKELTGISWKDYFEKYGYVLPSEIPLKAAP